ncbi:hypothetical protein D2M30_1079 [Bacillus amyloliquefaciens]|nr:hypothetical protein D2M30_1079 [Bacillus amyloliquefaciens]
MGFLPEKKYMYILIVPQKRQNKKQDERLSVHPGAEVRALSQKI